MKITISFKHLEHTESLDEKIREKTKKLSKYLGGRTEAKWTCYVKDGLHYAEVKFLGPSFDYHAKASSDNLYKTLDMVINKTERQISKRKDKWKNLKNKRSENPEFLDPEMAWTDYDEDQYGDVA